jgi:hypothetical protein
LYPCHQKANISTRLDNPEASLSKPEPKPEATYIRIFKAREFYNLPLDNGNQMPSICILEGRVCAGSKRIANVLARKRKSGGKDDTDPEDKITWIPEVCKTGRRFGKEKCTDTLFYWAGYLNRAIKTKHRSGLAARIAEMNFDEQWRAVLVWAKWAQGDNDVGAAVGSNAKFKQLVLDVGEFLEAFEGFMKRLRALKVD